MLLCYINVIFSYRFSSYVHCRICIIGLLERINKAYKSDKRHDMFVIDLVKLDVPNLFLVQSNKKDAVKVEQKFIGMVCSFIQKNTLRDVILSQIPSIMVSNHMTPK